MNPVELEVTADFMCPWCWIGHSHLKTAIAQAGVPVRVRYAPFELNPQMPAAGITRREYRIRKFGSWARSQALDAEVAAAGRNVGLEFDFERMERTPSTRLAHRMMRLVQLQSPERADAFYQSVCSAYFSQGRDIGELDVLLELASLQGLDVAALRTQLASGAQHHEVAAHEAHAHSIGINAVPTFQIADELFVGALPAQLLSRVLRHAAAGVESISN